MEHLPEDVLLIIGKKVAAFGNQDLLRFEVTSTYHQKLAHKKAVLKALPRDFLWYISEYWPYAGKRKFIQHISRSGHEAYNVVLAAQMLQGDRPDLEEIKLILKEATSHGSDGAKYFELMLKVLAKGGFLMDEVLLVFSDLFNRKQLVECERAIMNVEGPSSFWGYYWSRPLSQIWSIGSLAPQTGPIKVMGGDPISFCHSWGTNDEYSMTNLCVFCCLDVEIV